MKVSQSWLLVAWSLVISIDSAFSQQPVFIQDSTLNNLVHPAGYRTLEPGQLGRVTKTGTGRIPMIFVPGIGFGESAYPEFVEGVKNLFTVYTVTAAGFDGTAAPPMPPNGTPYSDMTWTTGVVLGILDLIAKEKLDKPVIVAHFVTGSQIALKLALEHHDKISRVIIMSGQPYRYYPVRESNGQFNWTKETVLPREQRNRMVENFWAPKWFKTVTNQTWISNNWQSEEYTKDSTKGRELVRISASVPLQVNIRYLLEFFSFDVTSRYAEIKTPVLILVPGFDEQFLTGKEEYLKYFQQESWNSARGVNPLIQFRTIPDARIFMWLDNPRETFEAVKGFTGY